MNNIMKFDPAYAYVTILFSFWDLSPRPLPPRPMGSFRIQRELRRIDAGNQTPQSHCQGDFVEGAEGVGFTPVEGTDFWLMMSGAMPPSASNTCMRLAIGG
jgi:hypothetical protein